MAIRITPGEVNSRRVLVAGAVIAIGIGWFGILDRKLYAAPHWIEPWPAIAAEATETVRQGGVVVANNSSFFFYLTYALGPDYLGTGATFHGYLPQWVRHPRIYNLGQWIQAGQPTGASTLLVKGLNYPEPPEGMQEIMRWMGGRCRVVEENQFVRDAGSAWKQRLAPTVPQPEWRIEIKRYACL